MTETLKTGIAAVDRYLANGYDEVRGFSSRYSATICGHLLRRQSELGIRGSVAEMGSVEKVIGDPKHPYTRLLVSSIPLPDPDARWGGEGILRASHDGELMIGDKVIKAAVLPNGKRLLTQGTFLQALGRSRTPKAGTGGMATPGGRGRAGPA